MKKDFSSQLSESVKNMAAKGMSKEQIEKALFDDLKRGGGEFSGVRKSLKNVTGKPVNISNNMVDADLWEWITTGNSPCKDCLPRQGVVKSYQEWEKIGLPRSGFSECKQDCECELIPASDEPHDFGGKVEIKSLEDYRNEFINRGK